MNPEKNELNFILFIIQVIATKIYWEILYVLVFYRFLWILYFITLNRFLLKKNVMILNYRDFGINQLSEKCSTGWKCATCKKKYATSKNVQQVKKIFDKWKIAIRQVRLIDGYLEINNFSRERDFSLTTNNDVISLDI